jgi:hypothetical protein
MAKTDAKVRVIRQKGVCSLILLQLTFWMDKDVFDGGPVTKLQIATQVQRALAIGVALLGADNRNGDEKADHLMVAVAGGVVKS